jgi:hypothetical protein
MHRPGLEVHPLEADGFTLLGHGVAPWERLRSLSLED